MSYNQIKVVVVDDEETIRKELIDTLNEGDHLEVVGQAESVDEAEMTILETSPDAIFLDIKLRGGDAFQLIGKLRLKLDKIPPIVINTGFRDFEFAQDIFNKHKDCVIQILQKPFWEDWEEKEKEIVALIKEKQLENRADFRNDRIIFKSGSETYIIYHSDFVYAGIPKGEKGTNRSVIKTKNNEFIIPKSLAYIQERLPSSFMRISRYHIVNLDFLESVNSSDSVIGLRGEKEKFGIGTKYLKELITILS